LCQPVTQKTITFNDEVRVIADVLKTDERIPHGMYEHQYHAKRQLAGRYNQGKREGKWTRYYDTGKPMIVGYYQAGKPTGEWKRFSRTGEELARFQFEDGKPDGHWYANYVTLNSGLDLIYEKGLLAQAVLYYSNQKPGYLQEQVIQKEDTLTYRSLYYRNQNIEYYQELKNGLRHGQQISYHRTGARWEELDYLGDTLHNVIAMRAQTGQPLVIGDFKDGKGSLNRYYANGILFKTESYQHGVLHGAVSYKQQGKEIGFGSYNAGQRTGSWEFMSSNFFKEVEFAYDPDQPNTAKVKRRLSANEKEADHGTLVNGARSGSWIRTNIMGDTIERATYKNGLLDGKFIKHTPTIHNIQAEGNYTCGTRSGKWEAWNPVNQQTFLDTMQCMVTCNLDLSRSPVRGWLPVQDVNGFWYLSEDALGESIVSRDLVHYIPPLPGTELIETPLNYDYHVIWQLEPKQGDELSYLPLLSPAEFPEGTAQELIYMDRHRDLRNKALEEELSGSMLVGLKIDWFGGITRVDILRGIQPEFDEGVKEFFRQMPVWTPATYNGLPIETYVVKRIDFSEAYN